MRFINTVWDPGYIGDKKKMKTLLIERLAFPNTMSAHSYQLECDGMAPWPG